MTDKTKQRIQELVPEVVEKYDRCMGCGYGFGYCKRRKSQGCPVRQRELTITLPVVLRAIQNTGVSISFYGNNKMWFVRSPVKGGAENATWDLTKDYDDQSEEFKRFLGKVLGV